MNLTEIAAQQAAVGRHRLRVAAALDIPMGVFGDLYRGGQPMLSMMFPASDDGRDFITNLGAALNPDVVSLTHDSYIRVVPSAENPHYAPGDFDRDFRAGDTTVLEALTVSTAGNDEAQLLSTVPYTRLPGGQISFQDDHEVASSSTSGRIDDELVCMLNGVFNPDIAEGLLLLAPTFTGTLIHLFDVEPWTTLPRPPGWTRTRSGCINLVGSDLEVLSSFVDLGLTDDDRARVLRSLS